MNQFAAMIKRSAHYHRERIAVVCGNLRRTFAQIDERSDRCAAALAALGCRRGDRIALLLENSCEYVEADIALLKAGLVRVPLNPRLTPGELSYILSDSGSRMLFYGAEFAGTVAAMAPEIPGVKTLICAGDPGQGGSPTAGHVPGAQTLMYEPLLAAAPLPFAAVDVTAADLHQILYTSGTTGKPKGATTTLGSRMAALNTVYIDEMPVRRDDVLLLCTSMAHGGGTKILPHFLKGARTVLLSRFDVAEFCRTTQAEQVTTSWFVPTMVQALLTAPQRRSYDLSSLHTLVYAAAPMPVEVLRRALAEFGPIFVQVYGLSEAPNPVLVLSREDHVAAGPVAERRLASAGRAVLHVEVRVVDEAGRDVSPGEVGEIVVRGANVMVEYWQNPTATAEVLEPEGWLHTGDMATVDEDGYVFIVDRKKDMIISGGYNIYPREVEEVLYTHPAVLECAVYGIPDPVWGESVQASVVTRPGTTVAAEDLIEHCRKELASYKKPRAIAFASDLPKNPNGKVLRRALREPYWQGMDRRV